MFAHIGENLLSYTDLKSVTGEKRIYTTPNGNKYPSITTVLSINSKEDIDKWRKKVGAEEADKISYRASTRGTAVHEIIEKYIDNDPNYRKGYMHNIYHDFLQVKQILDERIGVVYEQEAPLYSDYLGVAGRVDCVAEFDGVLSIIDFKTSRKPKKFEWIEDYLQQESFYAIAWEEQTGIPITQLVTIIAVDNSEPQVFIAHRDEWAPKLLETIKRYNEINLPNQS